MKHVDKTGLAGVGRDEMTIGNRERGVALVVVLSCLLLVSGLVLSFFMSVRTETVASRLAESGGRSRDLVDSATNVVMAQIRAATTSGAGVAWASQPGMIRTFGTAMGGPSNAPKAYYKLYSAEHMVWTPDAGPFSAAADVPANWHENPALFTDLNVPVMDLNGTRRFPIADAGAALSEGGTPAVKGFTLSGVPLAGAAATDNPLPMPVRWLYVLRDGKMTVPNEGSAGEARWTGGAAHAPTADNPIVGRVAFWTDDESTKVNINTAAGDVWAENLSGNDPVPGSFWDVPRINTTFEKERLARRQVGQFEYQRYPGHPATVYLSAVFPNLTREGISNVASRVQMGGSLGGTVIATEKVEVDADRLYASVDELVFDPLRGSQEGNGVTRVELERSAFFLTASSRAPETNLFNQPRISIWPLHAIDNEAHRTAFDRLIAFCARANGRDYSFKRADAYSPTADYELIERNRELYGYLQRLTSAAVPGFGGSFSAKYPEDRDQILTQIFDYVRSTNLFDDTLEPQNQNDPASWTFPTMGKQFTSARTRNSSNGRMGGLRGHGQVTPLSIPANDTMGFGRFNTLSEVGLHFICTADGSGQVDGDGEPLSPEDEAKLASNVMANRTLAGRVLEEDEMRVEVMFLMELFAAAQGWNALNQDFQIRVTGLDGLQVRGMGEVGFKSLGFPASATIHIDQQPFAHTRTIGGSNGFRVTLANRGVPLRVSAEGEIAKDSNSSTLANTYPFVSAPVTIKPGLERQMFLQYTGTEPIRVEIYAQKYGSIPAYSPGYVPDEAALVQTIRLDFQPSEVSGGALPSPTLVMAGHVEKNGENVEFTSTRENFWTFARTPALAGKAGRLAYITRPPNRTNRQNIGGLFRDTDTLRTLVPVHGDYRHVAARREVPLEVFVPHQYFTSSDQVAHSFTEGYQGHDLLFNSTREGKLASLSNSQNYHERFSPDVPFKTPFWGSDSGDWDHGTGITPDGAYINKPDEGHNAVGTVPYFANDWDHEASGPTFFSPNRQVMSAGMFGSLPTQIKAAKPVEERAWRTLLFRPDPSSGSFVHVGGQSPKDHLLLDLFWMPVVEPYAISEPFSTAGKINMNYQLMPFTYIERSTALRALLQSERVGAVPLTAVGGYKSGTGTNYRYQIEEEETLAQFEERFANNEIFRSASEICEVYLIPKGVPGKPGLKAVDMPLFWAEHALTGDNLRERPYATLYPRLTTKSNSYTVHYRVQVLQQASRSRGSSATEWAKWEDGRDSVQSEMRGSTTLERYVDPLDPSLPDFADPDTAPDENLDTSYRFRVINSKRFAP
ncbi:Verru_Chthon cassette protein A [Phragmitibacter flavus]|nr:Verru_Chthon cassette protein A [Phragmitibacter flavus]